MYQKYQTDALILGSRERGESDRTYTLYTRDFGLVRARASAVRAEGSRMRYALQNYSTANVSLVRGKRGWRIAGASAGTAAPEKSSALGAFARIAELASRLVVGEEENAFLFATLTEAHQALRGNADVASVEIVCVARLLYSLGYISTEALDTTLLSHTDYAIEHLKQVETHREALLKSINRAISETHL